MFILSSDHINRLLAYGKRDDLTFALIPELDNELTVSSPDYSVESLRIEGKYNSANRRTLKFNKVTFSGEVIISDPGLFFYLIFNDCIFESVVNISRYSDNILFVGANHFKRSTIIESPSSSTSLKIANANFEEALTLKGNFKDLSISNINEQLLNYDNLIIATASIFKFNLNQAKFSSVFIGEFKDLQIGNHVSFTNSVEIEGLEAKQFLMNNVKVGLVLRILKSNIDRFRISNFDEASNKFEISDNCNISDAVIPLGILKHLKISNCKFENLTFTDTNPIGKVVIIEKTTIVKKLSFDQILNKGTISLNQITIPSNGFLSIRGSNLGETNFLLCSISQATLEFENSKTTEIFTAGTVFPKKVYLDKSPDYSQAQLAFGQLQTASQKQGDTVQALEYHSREIEAHFKSIAWFSRDFFKKFNLGLNKISNNFGRFWVLGVIFTFASGLLFFCLLLISTDKYEWGTPKFDFELLPAYLKFMNPLRFIETENLFLNGKLQDRIRLNSCSYLCDFLGRVFVAYGFYQTIQAFRRFGRK
jgi:hypothetical protein